MHSWTSGIPLHVAVGGIVGYEVGVVVGVEVLGDNVLPSHSSGHSRRSVVVVQVAKLAQYRSLKLVGSDVVGEAVGYCVGWAEGV